jgi:DNA-binding transcriptional ArsR family regulator
MATRSGCGRDPVNTTSHRPRIAAPPPGTPGHSGAASADSGEAATGEALKAIAEPRRRAILRLVARDELAAGEIAAAFDVTRTAISQHVTVLKNAGLLAERRDGTRRLYRARPQGLAGLREFLDDMWESSLDAARKLVESERGITDDDQAASTG